MPIFTFKRSKKAGVDMPVKRTWYRNIWLYPVIGAILFVLLFPFLVMVSTALKSVDEVYTSPPYWVPYQLRFQNFREIWDKYPLLQYFTNSFLIASGSTGLNVLLSVPAAYAVSRLRFRGRRFLLYLFLVVQMFSPIIVVMSLFKVIANLGLLDTRLSLVLVNAVFTLAFSIWMLNGYFGTIPVELEEAAWIDGCTRAKAITKILLPIAMPGVVTTLIYTFIASWNEFMFALTFITSLEKRPLTIGLYNFIGRWSVQWQYLMAAALLAIIPVILLFLAIEKQLIKGLAGGAIKG
jgi:multiple sugar transport system permease protein